MGNEQLIDLSGKVAVVTGAGQSSGRTIALALAAQGAKVCLNDINPDSLRAVATEIESAGGTAMVYQMAVDKKMGIQTMFMEMLDQWERLDILVNTAHIPGKGSLIQLDEWNWDKILDVNLKGVFLCSQVAARVMQTQGEGGVIINLTQPFPQENRIAYQAAYSGLIGLTAASAADLTADNIRVMGVVYDEASGDLPAQLPTDITNLGGAILYLCTPEAASLSGQMLM